MRLFISWSGEQSNYVASALKNWIPDVLPSVEPWVSSSDIVPGVRWATELSEVLARSHFGILCLTKANLKSSWVLFEAGSLAKQLDLARVVPYLIDLRRSDLEFPLAQFQYVEATEVGTHALLQSINKAQESPFSDEKLARAFNKWWPDFRQMLDGLPADLGATSPARADREILEEILDISRSQYRTNLRPVSSLAPADRSARQGAQARIYWHEHGLTFEAAREFSALLEKRGIKTVLAKHKDPACPDAVFIGALIGAEDAQVVLANAPYTIKYIFRPDYPDGLGGDGSGLTIGVGYMSNHFQRAFDEASMPIPLTEEKMKTLCDPNLSNAAFQAMLRSLMDPPVKSSPALTIENSHDNDDDVGLPGGDQYTPPPSREDELKE
jgi:hypothetical protein